MFAMKIFKIVVEVANILESRKCPTASASCRKVAEFDTPLLCETRYDVERERRQRRQQNSLQTGRRSCCLPVAEFSAWNSVAPPGEKTSGNVLVKLTELSRGDAGLCRLRIPLRRAFRYPLSARIYGIVARRVCLSHLRSKTSFRAPEYFTCKSLGGFVCLTPGTRADPSLLVTAKSTPRY